MLRFAGKDREETCALLLSDYNRAANYRQQWLTSFRLYILVTQEYGLLYPSGAKEHQGSAQSLKRFLTPF